MAMNLLRASSSEQVETDGSEPANRWAAELAVALGGGMAPDHGAWGAGSTATLPESARDEDDDDDMYFDDDDDDDDDNEDYDDPDFLDDEDDEVEEEPEEDDEL